MERILHHERRRSRARFVYDVNREPGEATVRPNLYRNNLLKADTQSASWDGRCSDRKVPKRQAGG